MIFPLTDELREALRFLLVSLRTGILSTTLRVKGTRTECSEVSGGAGIIFRRFSSPASYKRGIKRKGILAKFHG